MSSDDDATESPRAEEARWRREAEAEREAEEAAADSARRAARAAARAAEGDTAMTIAPAGVDESTPRTAAIATVAPARPAEDEAAARAKVEAEGAAMRAREEEVRQQVRQCRARSGAPSLPVVCFYVTPWPRARLRLPARQQVHERAASAGPAWLV